jgi:hypothetical protein
MASTPSVPSRPDPLSTTPMAAAPYAAAQEMNRGLIDEST